MEDRDTPFLEIYINPLYAEMQTFNLYTETDPKRVSDERVVSVRNTLNADSEYICAKSKPRMRGQRRNYRYYENVNFRVVTAYLMRAARVDSYGKIARLNWNWRDGMRDRVKLGDVDIRLSPPISIREETRTSS